LVQTISDTQISASHCPAPAHARTSPPCLLAFLARYPARALRHVRASLGSRFPFDGEEPHHREEEAAAANIGRDLWREREWELEDARAEELRRELEKERRASASAADEATAMILRLQKEKSAREQCRATDERRVFYEDELEEFCDIVLLREPEVDRYGRLLGLAPEDEVMVTPWSVMPDSQPSSSRSAALQLGNNLGFSFKTSFLHQELDHVNGGVDNDCIALQTPPSEVPVVESKLELGSCEDDGTETVEILPLSARSLDFDQGADFHADAAAGTEEQTAGKYQEGTCRGMDTSSHDHSGSE
jgi:hypothetical protein